jgi:uncharacterized membrane protein YoaT (DUF817 family)
MKMRNCLTVGFEGFVVLLLCCCAGLPCLAEENVFDLVELSMLYIFVLVGVTVGSWDWDHGSWIWPGLLTRVLLEPSKPWL